MRITLAAIVFLAGCSGMEPVKDLPFLPPPEARVSVTLHAFDTGSVKAPRGFVAKGQGWFSRVTMDMPAFVIEHPKGLVVFDTGLPREIAEDPRRYMGRLNHMLAGFRQARGQDLRAQMLEAGLDPGKVRWVVVSHRHFDHLGGLRDFPNAAVVLARQEYEAANGRVKGERNHEPPPLERFQGLPSLQLVDFSTAPPFGSFEHSLDLLGDGSIVLLDASGHTAGSIAAYVRAGPEGTLLTGDASWTEPNWRLPARQYYAFDVDRHWRRLWQIRAWKDKVPRLVVLPGHDLGPIRRGEPGAILH